MCVTMTAPTLQIDTNTLSFPPVLTGTPGPTMQFHITNVGGSVLTLNGVFIGGLNPMDFRFNPPPPPMPLSLPTGGSVSIGIQFFPTAPGMRSAFVNIQSNDPMRPTVQVQLFGTGL
jgi:hypothetical protein